MCIRDRCGVVSLAEGLTVGNATLVDRRSAWWAHRYVLNLARGLRFDRAVADIRDAQRDWERRGAGALREMERLFTRDQARATRETTVFSNATEAEEEKDAAARAASAVALMTGIASRHADAARDAWWRLADALMAKFADGFVSLTRDGATVPGRSEGYPDWWLDAAGFGDGPPPPPDPPRNGRGAEGLRTIERSLRRARHGARWCAGIARGSETARGRRRGLPRSSVAFTQCGRRSTL